MIIMSYKNVIINKTIQTDIGNIDTSNKLIKKIDKYNNITSTLSTYNATSNFERIKCLNIYDYIIKNKILLYEPTEYNGFLTMIDCFYYKQYNANIDVLIDSDLYGSIELIKYIREHNDNFYVTQNVADNISGKGYEYLKKMLNIEIVKDDHDKKFDIVIVTNMLKVKYYQQYLKSNGKIFLVTQIFDINKNLFEMINSMLKIYNQIEFISPTIIKETGEFIIIFDSSSDDVITSHGNLMIKINDFFNYHLHRINKMLLNKLYISKITNIDVQNKIISVYDRKIMSQIINIMIIFNIPIKTKIMKYYENKLITINNKLYSSVNVLSYQFIIYEDNNIEFNKSLSEVKYTNLHNIAMNLNRIKRTIDTRYFKKWQYTTYQLDNYKSLGEYVSKKYKVLENQKEKVSNAFLKIYEMMCTYELLQKDKKKLKSFHFCEAPGMFIIGLNHYIQTKTNITDWEWYGNSLTIDADNTALTDQYGLIKKNSNRWLIGSQASGDIRDLENIKFFKEKLGEVDLITSDCGISVDISKLNQYEELIAETDFAQFINLLNLLSKGGSGLIKTFIPLELVSNVCIIYVLTQVFEKVYLSKPITSRPQNSEVYIICINYRGIDQQLLDKMKTLLDKKIHPKFDPRVSWIKNIPESFTKQLEDYIIDITRQQISYLLNIFHFVDNSNELDKLTLLNDNKLKDMTNKYWCDKFNFESNNNKKLI